MRFQALQRQWAILGCATPRVIGPTVYCQHLSMASMVSASVGRSAAPRQASDVGGMTASASLAGTSHATTDAGGMPLLSRLELQENQDAGAAMALLKGALREFDAGAASSCLDCAGITQHTISAV